MRSLIVIAIMALALIELGSSSSDALPNVPKPRPLQGVTPTLKFHRPTECRHLYNVGKHKEWSACMGVEYKPRRDM